MLIYYGVRSHVTALALPASALFQQLGLRKYS